MHKKKKDIKVLVTREMPDIGINLLKMEGFVVAVLPEDAQMDSARLIKEVSGFDALLSVGHNKLNEDALKQCSHLDIISQFGAGYDNIDTDAAGRLGIVVANTPNVVNDATADVAFGLMLAVSRKMFYMHKKIARGEWGYFRPKANLGMELKNKTLGVFGLGRIGMEVARRCKGAYDMDIIYHNRSRNQNAENLFGAKFVGFEELLEESDVLSVHCALSPETRGIFDISVFKKMKRSAIFINTSRGAVHHEQELIRALDEGLIWGAGLDVTDPEPMKADNPLLTMENVAVLPHIGSATVETRNEMSRLSALNIIEFYQSGHVKNAVNRPLVAQND